MSYINDPGARLTARAPDGTGNNAGGAAHDAYRRITPNSYEDGRGEMPLPIAPLGPVPAALAPFADYDGDLARPRDITEQVMAQPAGIDVPNRFGISEYFQFFGQFLTHDIAEAPLGAPSPVGFNSIFLNGLPFPFTRTPGVVDENGVRQQHNEETSFLDLSMVYGRTKGMLDLLRAGDDAGAQSARLLTSGDADNLLPTFRQVAADSGKPLDVVTATLGVGGPGFTPDQYAAGDNRANQNAGLLTHQTVWARNHNWHVDQLAAKHPDWTEEQRFNAARALNEAEFQHVVYDEYLAKLLGPGALGSYAGYKADVDPAAINEWATVAFRFGHDQSRNTVDRLTEGGESTETVTLAESFARANRAAAFGPPGADDAEVMNQWIRGQLSQATQEIDGKVVDGNRNALFGLPGTTVDLEVFDIQRGRDHGTHNLNNLREGLGLQAYSSVNQFAASNNLDNSPGTEARNALRTIYGNDIDAMDAVVGGLLEKGSARDSMLGETFGEINRMQFIALRDGDRFFYLNQFSDNPALIEEVQATSLSEIVARTTAMAVYRDAFLTHARRGGAGGPDSLEGTSGRDLLVGLGGDDVLTAGDDDDDLYGGAGNDTLAGGDGRDLLNGGPGDDALTGGSRADIFVFEGVGGRDRVLDFRNNEDKLDLSDYGWSFAEVQQRTAASGNNAVVIDVGSPGNGGSITVQGLGLSRLDASDLILVG